MQAIDRHGTIFNLQAVTNQRFRCFCGYEYITRDLSICPQCFAQLISWNNLRSINPGMFRPRINADVIFDDYELIWDLTKLKTKTDITLAIKAITEREDYMTEMKKTKTQVYNIRVESPFILTPKQIKEYLGIGYHVVSVETERDLATPKIHSVDSAVDAMIITGYRALARAYHPDLGGDPEVMMTLNKAKKEIQDLMRSLR